MLAYKFKRIPKPMKLIVGRADSDRRLEFCQHFLNRQTIPEKHGQKPGIVIADYPTNTLEKGDRPRGIVESRDHCDVPSACGIHSAAVHPLATAGYAHAR